MVINNEVTGFATPYYCSYWFKLLQGATARSDLVRVKSACNAGLDSPPRSSPHSSSLPARFTGLVLLSFFPSILSKNPNQPDYDRVQGILTLVSTTCILWPVLGFD